jgi:transglutaminase-like putative cysteine protease
LINREGIRSLKLLTVCHSTTYRYSEPVRFGTHRLMLRPRDSHDLRLLGSRLALWPPGNLHWLHDVFGNSVAFVDFAQAADELSIVSTLKLQRFGGDEPMSPIAAAAATYPFVYSADDRIDLGRLLEPHYPDPHGAVADWAHQFVGGRGGETLQVLAAMNGAIKGSFDYVRREDEGTQPPTTTIERQSGSCRDFALLLIEAARCLGLGARFVSGYIYDPALEGRREVRGGGATHAWADIYLPGAGWIEYDPTNGLIAEENLIRVAVTRDPSQAVPVSGSFIGTPSSEQGMIVTVTVTAAASSAD